MPENRSTEKARHYQGGSRWHSPRRTLAKRERRGGRAKAQSKLSLTRIERELPPLTDLDSAQQRLAIVSNWLAAGLLSGTAGHAFVRAHEVWLRAADSRLSAELVGDVRQRVEELESQLKQRSLGADRNASNQR